MSSSRRRAVAVNPVLDAEYHEQPGRVVARYAKVQWYGKTPNKSPFKQMRKLFYAEHIDQKEPYDKSTRELLAEKGIEWTADNMPMYYVAHVPVVTIQLTGGDLVPMFKLYYDSLRSFTKLRQLVADGTHTLYDGFFPGMDISISTNTVTTLSNALAASVVATVSNTPARIAATPATGSAPQGTAGNAASPLAAAQSSIDTKPLEQQVISRITALGATDIQQAYAEADKLASNRMFSHLRHDLVTCVLPALYGVERSSASSPSQSSTHVLIPILPRIVDSDEVASDAGTAASSGTAACEDTTVATSEPVERIVVSDSDTEDQPAEQMAEQLPAKRQKVHVKWTEEGDVWIETAISDQPNATVQEIAAQFEARQTQMLQAGTLLREHAHTSKAVESRINMLERQFRDWDDNEVDYLRLLIAEHPSATSCHIADLYNEQQADLDRAGTLSKNRMWDTIQDRARRLSKRMKLTEAS